MNAKLVMEKDEIKVSNTSKRSKLRKVKQKTIKQAYFVEWIQKNPSRLAFI